MTVTVVSYVLMNSPNSVDMFIPANIIKSKDNVVVVTTICLSLRSMSFLYINNEISELSVFYNNKKKIKNKIIINKLKSKKNTTRRDENTSDFSRNKI